MICVMSYCLVVARYIPWIVNYIYTISAIAIELFTWLGSLFVHLFGYLLEHHS